MNLFIQCPAIICADADLDTVLFLASPAADFITSQTLIVDGGKQFI